MSFKTFIFVTASHCDHATLNVLSERFVRFRSDSDNEFDRRKSRYCKMQKNKTFHDEMRSSQSTIARRYDKRSKKYGLSIVNQKLRENIEK